MQLLVRDGSGQRLIGAAAVFDYQLWRAHAPDQRGEAAVAAEMADRFVGHGGTIAEWRVRNNAASPVAPCHCEKRSDEATVRRRGAPRRRLLRRFASNKKEVEGLLRSPPVKENCFIQGGSGRRPVPNRNDRGGRWCLASDRKRGRSGVCLCLNAWNMPRPKRRQSPTRSRVASMRPLGHLLPSSSPFVPQADALSCCIAATKERRA